MVKRNVYVGHRYVPKVVGEWDSEVEYEGLSIVTHKGSSYTSKKAVPKGLDILNLDYWVLTGNYDAQVESYREVVRSVERKVDRVSDDFKAKTTLNIVDFPRESYEDTDDGRIERALNSFEKGTLMFPAGKFTISKEIMLDDYQRMEGVFGETEIIMVDRGVSRERAMIKVIEGGSKFWVSVKGFNLTYRGSREVFGIDLSSSGQVSVEDVYIKGLFKKGMVGYSVWLATLTNVTAWCEDYNNHTAFDFEFGTSINMNTVWSKNFKRGFNLNYVMYCSLNGCGVDSFDTFAYTGGQATAYNGCGAEDGKLVKDGFVFGNYYRTATFNSCQTVDIDVGEGVGKGETSIFRFEGSRVIVNTYRQQSPPQEGSKMDLIHSIANARSTFNNCEFHEFYYTNKGYNRKVVVDSHSGVVTINDGGTTETHYSDGEKVLSGVDKDFELGYRKVGDRVVSGNKDSGDMWFIASNLTHTNSHRFSLESNSSHVDVLEIKPEHSGTNTVLIDLDIRIANQNNTHDQVESSRLSIQCLVVNGVKKVGSVKLINGDLTDHRLVVSWSGNKLRVSSSKPYSMIIIDTAVDQVVSNGQHRIKWL